MKKKILLACLVASTLNSAWSDDDPYKIVIVTDPVAKVRAQEFENYLKTKPPFSRMGAKLSIEIVEMSVEAMNCQNNMPNSERIIRCNNEAIAREQSSRRGNLAMAFTSNARGGAGGGIPVASMDFPIQTMFHEMLHTFGLADEYDYSAAEQTVYCRNPRSRANIAYFRDTPPYADDPAARGRHNRDIPWYGGIPAAKLITTGTNLESPPDVPFTPGNQTMGLYRGGSCNSAALPGWRPYHNSIMKGYADDTIYPIYEEIIVRNLESAMGASLDLPPPEVTCLQPEYNVQRVEDLHEHVDDAVGRIPHTHTH